MRNKITNLHVYPSTFKNESRILKETKSLLDLNLVNDILLVGIWKEGFAFEEKIDDRRRIIRIKVPLITKFGILNFFINYFLFQILVIRKFRKTEFNLINCHSLSVLGIGNYFKIFRKIPLIYDAHELETEVEGARGIKKTIGKFLESIYIRYVDELIVVSNSIEGWYKTKYPELQISTVRNVPYYFELNTKSNLLREKFRIGTGQIVFIYQGLLSPSRGVDIILDTFRQVSDQYHIVFMGMGEMVDEIKELETRYGNIHFLPAVPPSEIHLYTSSADVGIHLIQNTCLNHFYCSPNKIFEYLLYGIPQIISNFPDMMRVLDNDKCGWGIEPNTEQLKCTIDSITPLLVKEKKTNVLQQRKNWGWHIEEMELEKVYNRIAIKIK
jgi:glycosyltransferase involved in cell wall biosynthesis